MTVHPARTWIWSLETLGIKLGLDAMHALLAALDHPHHAFHSIIVAGTNGKGSVTAMIERGLRAAGRRTGRYTSPHLTDIEERIAVDGDPISAEAFDAAAARVQAATASWPTPPSFFEATTALALEAFRTAGVDIAVLEVGLGGRLDATNAVAAPLAVITRIGLDHQQYLGDTLADIAAEKAGVIARDARVVVAPNAADAMAVVLARAEDQHAQVYDTTTVAIRNVRADARGTTVEATTTAGHPLELHIALAGAHQVDNARTALRALEVASDAGWLTVSDEVLQTAVGDVHWPARLEWRTFQGRDVLVDGAHNGDGAEALAAFLAAHVPEPVTLVVGIMRDKAIEAILRPLLARAGTTITTAVAGPRALAADDLAAVCRRLRPDGQIEVSTSPEDGLARATRYRAPIVVAGSLYLAGHVRSLLA